MAIGLPESTLQSKVVTLGDVEIAYSEGPDHGPVLLVLHGLTGNRHSFDALVPYLVDHYKLYLVDHRGHGLSGHTPGSYHVDVMAEDTAQFVQKVVGNPCFVLGHSMGGRIALKLAATSGSLTRAIVLEDPPLSHGVSVMKVKEIFEFWLELVHSNLSEETMVLELAKFNGDDDLERHRYKARTLKQMDPLLLEDGINGKLWPENGITGLFSKVTCPSFLFQADTKSGGLIDDDLSEIQELQVPNWGWKKVPGAGHSIHAEMPEAFARDIHGFFSKCLLR